MWPLLSFFVDLRIIQYVVMFNNNVRQVVFEIQSHATLKDGVLSWYQVNMDPVSMVLFLIHFYKIRWLFTIWLIWADFLFISLLWLILYIYNNFFICALLFWIPFKIMLEMMQKSSDLMQDMSRNGFVIVTFPANCLGTFWPAFYLNHSDCILTKNWKKLYKYWDRKKNNSFLQKSFSVFFECFDWSLCSDRGHEPQRHSSSECLQNHPTHPWSRVNCVKTCLNERVDVQHESLSPADDELIDAGDGMRPVTQ